MAGQGLALVGTVSNEVRLEPRQRVALLRDLRTRQELDQQIKALETKKKELTERVEAVREESGLDTFEIDGFTVTLVAPVRQVLNEKKLLSLGCKIEWLKKATEAVPSTPYTKISAPK
jgi:hypothetical protein